MSIQAQWHLESVSLLKQNFTKDLSWTPQQPVEMVLVALAASVSMKNEEVLHGNDQQEIHHLLFPSCQGEGL